MEIDTPTEDLIVKLDKLRDWIIKNIPVNEMYNENRLLE